MSLFIPDSSVFRKTLVKAKYPEEHSAFYLARVYKCNLPFDADLMANLRAFTALNKYLIQPRTSEANKSLYFLNSRKLRWASEVGLFSRKWINKAKKYRKKLRIKFKIGLLRKPPKNLPKISKKKWLKWLRPKKWANNRTTKNNVIEIYKGSNYAF